MYRILLLRFDPHQETCCLSLPASHPHCDTSSTPTSRPPHTAATQCCYIMYRRRFSSSLISRALSLCKLPVTSVCVSFTFKRESVCLCWCSQSLMVISDILWRTAAAVWTELIENEKIQNIAFLRRLIFVEIPVGFSGLENHSGGFNVKGSESTDHFMVRREGGTKGERTDWGALRGRAKQGNERGQKSTEMQELDRTDMQKPGGDSPSVKDPIQEKICF